MPEIPSTEATHDQKKNPIPDFMKCTLYKRRQTLIIVYVVPSKSPPQRLIWMDG